MSSQMSLFPNRDLPEDDNHLLAGEQNALDEMFTATRRFYDRRQYMELLQFIARFPKYSPFNGFLLYTQNPEVSFVATAGNWQKQYKRRLRPSARALIILAPMSPVRFVYDIEDTEGKPIPPVLLKPFTTTDSLPKDIIEKTINNCALHGIIVREVLISRQTHESAIPITDDIRRQYQDLELDARMDYLILINSEHRPEDKYAALVQELASIFCGHRGGGSNTWWQDRQQLKAGVKQVEVQSVAYLVCQRKGLVSNAAAYLKEYQTPDEELPALGFNGVLQAASYIESMGKSKWKKPKKTR